MFAPCATGGLLSDETIPRLACRVVAGSANNQLATAADGERLAAAGILYAPDYVINAGGVIHLAGYETLGWDDAQMAARLAGIGATLDEVFATADLEGISTAAAADRLATARIEPPRGGRARRGRGCGSLGSPGRSAPPRRPDQPRRSPRYAMCGICGVRLTRIASLM